jgi:hypothetical protein
MLRDRTLLAHTGRAKEIRTMPNQRRRRQLTAVAAFSLLAVLCLAVSLWREAVSNQGHVDLYVADGTVPSASEPPRIVHMPVGKSKPARTRRVWTGEASDAAQHNHAGDNGDFHLVAFHGDTCMDAIGCGTQNESDASFAGTAFAAGSSRGWPGEYSGSFTLPYGGGGGGSGATQSSGMDSGPNLEDPTAASSNGDRTHKDGDPNGGTSGGMSAPSTSGGTPGSTPGGTAGGTAGSTSPGSGSGDCDASGNCHARPSPTVRPARAARVRPSWRSTPRSAALRSGTVPRPATVRRPPTSYSKTHRCRASRTSGRHAGAGGETLPLDAISD